MSEADQRKLVEAAMTIGAIAECNCHYTEGLAKKIAATGKSVGDLTVTELMNIDVDYAQEYNDMLPTLGDSHLQQSLI